MNIFTHKLRLDPDNLSLFTEFTAVIGAQSFTANYKSKVSFQINLPIDTDISFHDPWQVDEFDELYGPEHVELLSNLCENGICDVFPNQGYSVGEWNYPYYKIVAKRLFQTQGSLSESISGYIYRLYELDESGDIISPENIFTYDIDDFVIDEIQNNNFNVEANIEIQREPISNISVGYISQNSIVGHEYEIYNTESLTLMDYSYIEFEEDNELIVYGELKIVDGCTLFFNGWGEGNSAGIHVYGMLEVRPLYEQEPNTITGYYFRGVTGHNNAQIYIENTEISYAVYPIAYGGYDEEFENPWGSPVIEIIDSQIHDAWGSCIQFYNVWDQSDNQVVTLNVDNTSFYSETIEGPGPSVLLASLNSRVTFQNCHFEAEIGEFGIHGSLFITDAYNLVTLINNEFVIYPFHLTGSGELTAISNNFTASDIGNGHAITIVKTEFGSEPPQILDEIATIEAAHNIDLKHPLNPFIPSRTNLTTKFYNNTMLCNVEIVDYSPYTPSDILDFQNNSVNPLGYHPNPNEGMFTGLTYEYHDFLGDCPDNCVIPVEFIHDFNCIFQPEPDPTPYLYGSYCTGSFDYQTIALNYGEINADPEWSFSWEDPPYTPSWISPLINVGNPDLNDNEVTWETDSYDQDTDLTRMDIGKNYLHITRGDVDNDNSLTVLDVQQIGTMIVNPGDPYFATELTAADYNRDFSINVLDQIALVNCIINSDCLWLERYRLSGGFGSISFAVSNDLSRTTGQDWDIVLETDEQISGIQLEFDINSQEESLINVGKGSIVEPLILDYSVVGNHVTLLLYPITGYSIPPGIQDILTLNFESLDRSKEQESPTLSQVILVNSEGEIVISDQSSDFPSELSMGIYPNPFNATTGISFNLKGSSQVILTVYDVMGRQVAELINNELTGGNHKAIWDAAKYPSGQYIVKLETSMGTESQKVLLVK